jgi:transposase
VAGRPTKLTAEVHRQVIAYVRAGAFSWVAAEAAGVSRTTFYRWLQRGDKEGRGAYHEFAEEVRQAQAQARVAAETEVRRTSPATWLRYGPGRDRPDAPGWTEQRQIAGLDGGPVQLREVTREELRRLARRIAE